MDIMNPAIFIYDPINDYARYCIDSVNNNVLVEIDEYIYKDNAYRFLTEHFEIDKNFAYLNIVFNGYLYKAVVLNIDMGHQTYTVLLPHTWMSKYGKGFSLEIKYVNKSTLAATRKDLMTKIAKQQCIGFEFAPQNKSYPSHIKQTRSINDKECDHRVS